MFCAHCGTEFEGDFCPKCGQAAGQASAPQPASNHRYYDKDGDEIDLSVIYGIYKTRKMLNAFFERCTNYSKCEVSHIVDYMFESITPKKYGIMEASQMQRQIESNLSIGRKLVTPFQRIVCGGIAVIGFLFVIFCTVYLFFPSAMHGAGATAAVTKARFESIETGMSYTAVVKTFDGDKGELLSEVDIGDPQLATQVYAWYGTGDIGANCNITFQGGQVIAKAQYGLS